MANERDFIWQQQGASSFVKIKMDWARFGKIHFSFVQHSGKPACKTVDEQGIGHFRGHPKVSREIAERVVARLRFSTEDSERILLLVERHDTPLGDNEKLVRRSLSRIGEARFRDLLSIKKVTRSVRAPAATMWRSCLRPKRC